MRAQYNVRLEGFRGDNYIGTLHINIYIYVLFFIVIIISSSSIHSSRSHACFIQYAHVNTIFALQLLFYYYFLWQQISNCNHHFTANAAPPPVELFSSTLYTLGDVYIYTYNRFLIIIATSGSGENSRNQQILILH